MTWVLLALALLASGVIASLLAARHSGASLLIGVTASGLAGALCLPAGIAVLRGAPAGSLAAHWPLPLGAAYLALDGLSAWFLIVIGVVAVPASLYSWGYFAGAHKPPALRAFGPLLCVLVAALILVVSAADAVLFLVGWELMSLSAFFLIGFHDEDPEARRGAWMYLVATHLGTAVGVLPLLAALVSRSGSTAFGGFPQALSAAGPLSCVVLFVLGVVGFGTKAGFMPFHVWLPAAHPVAPSPISALMSGVVIKTGIYGLLRLLSWLPALPAGCGLALLTLAVVSAVMGILYALAQHQLKRMLAYSSIENIGLIGVSLAVAVLGRSLAQPALEALGLAGALLHVLNHALFKGLLFLSAGAVLHHTGTGEIERLGGLARRAPLTALPFVVGAAAICALPPLNGFLSEFLIYSGLLRGVVALPHGYAALSVIVTAAMALVGGLALLAFSRVFAVVFLGEARDPAVPAAPSPGSMSAAMLALAAGCGLVSLLAPALPSVLSAVIRPFVADAPPAAAALGDALAPLTRAAAPLGVLVILAVGLFLARRALPRSAATGGSVGTWGCGFARPAPRMQYSASSYVWSVLQNVGGVLRLRRRGAAPTDYFPSRGQLSTTSADLALEGAYAPLFTRVSRACERLWPLQHGRIQLYLVYIVLTVVIVFVVEAAWGPARRAPVARPQPAADAHALHAAPNEVVP